MLYLQHLRHCVGFTFNSFASGKFRVFHAKNTDCTWLCESVILVLNVVESCSKAQKT